MGDVEHAIADCNQALTLEPKLVLAYFGRAAAFRKKGDNDSSIKDMDEVIRIDPSLASAYAARAARISTKADARGFRGLQ